MTDTRVTDGPLRAEIRAIIYDNFLYMEPDLKLSDDDALMGLALLDSLAFVELVDHLETKYGVAVRDTDITEENLGSVTAIARFVAARSRS
jgi:acyl carrier protein